MSSLEEYNGLALDLFHWQAEHNKVYRAYCELMKVDPASVTTVTDIPFLPIELFKSHEVMTGEFNPEVVFESSGTTGSQPSRHLLRSLDHYKNIFIKGFELEYGDVANLCIIGLLPSYLERGNSSLVAMVDELIRRSDNPKSGFYLNEFDELDKVLRKLEEKQTPVLLIGVSFALLDLAESHGRKLDGVTIMETGGMKGRREELVRSELHDRLKNAFGVRQVHSEYGMTELMSQAYSKYDGVFDCPPWMKVYVRDIDDPVTTRTSGRGALNIIDLANIDSCCFIATQDVGTVHENGLFEVQGRMDHSDVRGCNLLVI